MAQPSWVRAVPTGREQNQIMPAFAQRDRRHAEVEQRDVKKERGRVIRTAPKQHRGEKAA